MTTANLNNNRPKVNKSKLIFPILVVGMIILFLALLYQSAGETMSRQHHTIDSLQTELDYYKNTYHYRVGTIYNEYSEPITIRALSIDDGKNWLIIDKGREVQNERYLHNAYPDVNPDSLQKVY